jgi:DNA-binding NtrC family response regulator
MSLMDSPKRALVVDDDEPIRMMLAKVVERQNLAVDTARDGAEAIERIDKNGSYALIILDLMMPKVDGFAVLSYMQEHHPDLVRCTIIASAVPEREILKNFDGGVFRIHAKPFDMSQLIDDIRRCAESN